MPGDDDFISEPIEPIAGTFDTSGMSRGEAGLPREFMWRDSRHVIERVIATWKTSTPDRGELYLRRHWFEIETSAGERMKLYCERQARSTKQAKHRWFLYSISRS
jgi:hypothetical protein